MLPGKPFPFFTANITRPLTTVDLTLLFLFFTPPEILELLTLANHPLTIWKGQHAVLQEENKTLLHSDVLLSSLLHIQLQT